MRRPRVVLDAGVLVGALLRPQGPPGGLLRLLARERAFELVMSDAIMEELRQALSDPAVLRHLRVSEGRLDRLAAAVGLLATQVNGTWSGPALEDRGDEKYLAAAVESGAEMIVTSDPHLLDLDLPQPVQMVTPRVLLEVLELDGERRSE